MTQEGDSIDSLGAVGAVSAVGASGDAPQEFASPASRAPAARPASPPPNPSAGADPQTAPVPPSAASIQRLVRQINQRLAAANRFLELRVDPETGITVAELRNGSTGEVIQQIPSTDMMHLAQMLYSWTHGDMVFVDLLA